MFIAIKTSQTCWPFYRLE